MATDEPVLAWKSLVAQQNGVRKKKGRAQILQQCCEMSHQLTRRWGRASTCIYKLLKSDFGGCIWSGKSDSLELWEAVNQTVSFADDLDFPPQS